MQGRGQIIAHQVMRSMPSAAASARREEQRETRSGGGGGAVTGGVTVINLSKCDMNEEMRCMPREKKVRDDDDDDEEEEEEEEDASTLTTLPMPALASAGLPPTTISSSRDCCHCK